MNKKLLVVFGATGQQGGSVINSVLADPSRQYTLRGVTRDPSTTAAQALHHKGVQVVAADLADGRAVTQAVAGAHTVFSVTLTSGVGEAAAAQEIEQGKRIADAVVAAGARYLIYSSMTDVAELTAGKYSGVLHFDCKNVVERYIRGLPIASAFIYPGSFMSNYAGQQLPRSNGDGSYTIANCMRPDTRLPLIDVADDTGKWIAAVLAEPDKYQGQVLRAATREYTLDEVAQLISKATGKTVTYKQVPDEALKAVLPPAGAEQFLQMFQFCRDFNYFGPQQKELVEWSAEQARGNLTSFEDYLHKYPIRLD